MEAVSGYPLMGLYKVWRLIPNLAANAFFSSPSLRRLISSIYSLESFAVRPQCLPLAIPSRCRSLMICLSNCATAPMIWSGRVWDGVFSDFWRRSPV